MPYWYALKDLIRGLSIRLSVIEFWLKCFLINRSNLALSTTDIPTKALDPIPIYNQIIIK
jgi:hypothetical protein